MGKLTSPEIGQAQKEARKVRQRLEEGEKTTKANERASLREEVRRGGGRGGGTLMGEASREQWKRRKKSSGRHAEKRKDPLTGWLAGPDFFLD